MPTILLTNKYSPGPLELVRSMLPAGYDLISLSELSKQEFLRKATDADYFLASGRMKIDAEIISAATNLKMIQRTGVGLDTIDQVALREAGIPLYVNKGVNASSVAEHTIMLILAVLRRLPHIDSSVKSGKWLKNELGLTCQDLRNKKVGLLGLGTIGINVARILQALQADIFYYKRNRLPDIQEQELEISYKSFTELLEAVDILSIHCSLTDVTQYMIGEREITRMKTGAILVNTARGNILDEKALIKHLKSGHIRAAGLDVFSNEPIETDNPLLSMDNVILTPHIGGISKDTYSQMLQEAISNIVTFHNGDLHEIEHSKIRHELSL